MSQILILKERLHTVLCSTGKDRDKRQEMIDRPDGHGREAAWAVYEREQMLRTVNQERAKLRKQPLLIKEIEQVEQLAIGHTDYGEKFALYCAELVLQEK